LLAIIHISLLNILSIGIAASVILESIRKIANVKYTIEEFRAAKVDLLLTRGRKNIIIVRTF